LDDIQKCDINSFENMFFALILSTILQIGPIQLDVEIADTPSLRDKGLMGRSSIAKGSGMLFVYEKPQILCFWMKNTKIPLSIGFFDENQILQQIENMDPPQTQNSPLRLYKSLKPMQYAIEVPQNWFNQNNITIGEKFTFLDSSK
jgi:uncharacterized protein